jgi:hypothetical protein
MIEDIDIFRSAVVFINKYGENAKAEAALTALKHENLSAERLAIWCRIVEAIAKLQKPRDSQSCVQ